MGWARSGEGGTRDEWAGRGEGIEECRMAVLMEYCMGSVQWVVSGRR